MYITLQGINISHRKGSSENHLQNAIFGGYEYVSSLEGKMYTYVFFFKKNLEAPVGIGIPTFNNVCYIFPNKFFWDPGSSTYRRFKLEALERNRLRERRIVCKPNKWSKMFKRRQRFGHFFFCQQKKKNFLPVLPVRSFL